MGRSSAAVHSELGEEIAQQIMETVLKVRRQVEGAGSTAQAACEAKVADCQAIFTSMQEKVLELMENSQAKASGRCSGACSVLAELMAAHSPQIAVPRSSI